MDGAGRDLGRRHPFKKKSAQPNGGVRKEVWRSTQDHGREPDLLDIGGEVERNAALPATPAAIAGQAARAGRLVRVCSDRQRSQAAIAALSTFHAMPLRKAVR